MAPGYSRLVAPSAPQAPSAAAEDEVRPLPPMKIELCPDAWTCVFCGFGCLSRTRAGMACLGVNIVFCIIKLITFTTDPEVARFWTPILRVWLYLLIAFAVLMACVCTYQNMPAYGEFVQLFDPRPLQQPAAVVVAAEQLPPPPPQMDMC